MINQREAVMRRMTRDKNAKNSRGYFPKITNNLSA